MIPPHFILPIFAIAVTLFLGGVVLFNNVQNKINRTFSFFAFWAAFWVFSVLMTDVSKNLASALFWARMCIVGPSLFSPILVYLSYIFPFERKKIDFWKIILLFSPTIIFLIFTPTKFNVERVWPESWGTNFTPGILYYLLIVYIFLYFGLSFINFFRSYQIVSGLEKTQILYIFFGFLSGVAIGITTNAILPLLGYAQLSSIGPTFSMFGLVVFTGYAILKHYLFNIKVIATEILTFGVLLLLFINIFAAQNLIQSILNIGIFLGTTIFGIFLIRSVWREVMMRERMQKLALDLEAANKELQRLDKARTEFMSMASHQLRTPLAAIKGYISLALEGQYGQIPEKLRQKLENVYLSNERLINLVRDLLTVSRIEMGKLVAEKELTKIEDLIESCISEMKIVAEKKGLKLYFTKPKTLLPKINIDSLKIRQVFLNLIDNAIRYTQKGEIEVRAEKTDSKILISFRDTGEGLIQEEKTTIFEGFTRGRAGIMHFIEGAGLGLYVAKKYLDLHNGKIWAESEGKGKGSTFYVEIPISQ